MENQNNAQTPEAPQTSDTPQDDLISIPENNPRLLPNFCYSFRSLIWVWVIPHLLMIFGNLFYLWIFSDKTNFKNSPVLTIAIAQGVSLLAGLFMALFCKRKLSATISGGFLVYFICWFFLLFIMNESTYQAFGTDYLIDTDYFFYIQIYSVIFMGSFFGMRVSAYRYSDKLEKPKDSTSAILISVFSVAALYGAVLIFEKITRARTADDYIGMFSAFTAMGFFIFIGSVFSIIVGNAFLIFQSNIESKSPFHKNTFCAAISAFISLWVFLLFHKNTSDAFARDFALMTIIYIINAGLMFAPLLKLRKGAKKILLFASAATFTAITYLALLFLPAIALSPILVISILGIPFLFPAVIFMFSMSRLHEIYISIKGREKIAILVLGLLFLPSCVVIESFVLRVNINATLNYVENFDISKPRVFKGNKWAAIKSIEWIDHYKNGLHVPFITPLRMAILSNGMVLSDAKTDKMLEFFKAKPKDHTFKRNFNVSNESLFNTEILDAKIEKNTERKNIDNFHITLKNLSSSWKMIEAAASIKPSEGVFVCGMSMEVLGVEKRASFVEKRAALWTYKEITRRMLDPSIIYYKTLSDMLLRVSPLRQNESKRVTVSFLSPPNFKGSNMEYSAKMSGKTHGGSFSLGENGQKNILASVGKNSSYVLINNDGENFYSFERKPYWALILDLSENKNFKWTEKLAEEKILNALKILKEEIPSVNEAKIYGSSLNFAPIYMANFENETWTLSKIKCNFDIMNTGGFDFASSMLFAMADYVQKNFSVNSKKIETPNGLKKFPIPVFITDKNIDFKFDGAFKEFAPELGQGFALKLRSSGLIENASLGKSLDFKNAPFIKNKKVSAFRMGDEVRVAPLGIGSIIFNSEIRNKNELKVFDGENFSECKNEIFEIAKPESLWAQAALLWKQSIEMKRNPSKLDAAFKDMIAKSKALEIVIPISSAIIVETSKQEESMKLLELQTINTKAALQFDEDIDVTNMSEPPLWLWVLIAFIILIFKRPRNFVLRYLRLK